MVAFPRLVLAAAALSLHLCPTAAQAQEHATEPAAADIGGFVGMHAFSPRSTLGAVGGDGASIASSLALGIRLSIPVSSLVAIEGELPLIPTTAREGDTALLVLEPRVLARVGGGVLGGVEPFANVGLGLPMVISSDNDVIGHDVVAALHAGVGVRIAREAGWNLRMEARTAIVPARGIDLAAFDFEVTLGLYRPWGKVSSPRQPLRLIVDSDGDGVPDEDDLCPDLDEDLDGIEDHDGCPDIDDDRDGILDTVDQCRLAPETYNGFRDEDGCPDRIPDELAALVDNPGALLFATNSTRLRSSGRAALRRLAGLLDQHESVRMLLVGHADDREGKDDAAGLALQRAEAVRDFLVEAGVEPARFEVRSAAAAHPHAGNESARGRTQNRRVTLRILRSDIPLESQVPAAPGPSTPAAPGP